MLPESFPESLQQESESCFTFCQKKTNDFYKPFSFSIKSAGSEEQKEPLIKEKYPEPDTEIRISYAPPLVPLLSEQNKNFENKQTKN